MGGNGNKGGNANYSVNNLPKFKDITHFAFPQMGGPRVNLVFITPAQFKVKIIAPINCKVGDILKEYTNKVGVGPQLLGNGIYFLFNGAKIKKQDENKTIIQYGLAAFSNIIVLDPKFVIGALK